MPVYRNDTDTNIIESFRTADGIEKKIVVEVGKTITTEQIFTVDGLTLISAAPYFNPMREVLHTLTSTGAADPKTQAIDIDTKELSIWNSSSVLCTVFLQATANTPGIPVYPNSERIIDLNRNVNSIIVQFATTATIYVEEKK